ncbi:MAG TPA: hypothetical protein VMC10_25995 [Stellaceae bacterium]|nr:hypothetical protein [Stellaceae bacterium]
MMIRSILLALMLALAACGQAQQSSFSPTKLANLQIGKTTYDQAVAELGQPSSQSQLPDGRRLANYEYLEETQTLGTSSARGGVISAHSVPTSGGARTDVYQLQFGSNGVLQSYSALNQ